MFSLTSVQQQYTKLSQMKSFMISHLHNLQNQHKQKISQMQTDIQTIKNKKELLSKQLSNIRQKIKGLQETNMRLQARNIQLENKVVTVSMIQRNSLSDDMVFQYLKEAPMKIIKFLKKLKAQQIELPLDYGGTMTVVLLGADKLSLQKFVNINESFVKKCIKSKKSQAQLILVHNPLS